MAPFGHYLITFLDLASRLRDKGVALTSDGIILRAKVELRDLSNALPSWLV